MQPDWPNDVDGDVFRRMEESGFDFSKYQLIDFNVDFEEWPPTTEALAVVRHRYPNAVLRPPDGEDRAHVQFQVHALVTYDLVIRIQREMSELMADFGGRCESWGVMQDEV